MVIRGAEVLCEDYRFRQKDVGMEDGIFVENGRGTVEDASGCYAVPGLVDVHFHGCVGEDISDGSAEGLARMARYEAGRGITTIVPAVMTLPAPRLMEICDMAASFSGEEGAVFAGIHLEGPYLSGKKKGAQNGAFLQKPDAEQMGRFCEAAGGMLRIMTIAPELEGAEEVIRAFSPVCGMSIGHTDCDYETARQAFRWGADGVTHLFNAMNGLHHREPGAAAAALEDSRCMAEMICDGIHVHPAVVRLAYRLLTAERMVLISDSMRAAGMPDGIYTLGGQDVEVRGKHAFLKGTETLAGSASDLMDCVRTAVEEVGLDLASAIRCASENPARRARLFDQCGSITPGKRADLVLLDRQLKVRAVYVRGKKQKIWEDNQQTRL